MTAFKDFLTPRGVLIAVAAIAALAAIDYFFETGVLAWFGEQLSSKAPAE